MRTKGAKIERMSKRKIASLCCLVEMMERLGKMGLILSNDERGRQMKNLWNEDEDR